MSDPIEVTTRYATSVSSLAEAWVFVMDRVDKVGDSPTVQIKPLWRSHMQADDDEWTRVFEVVVEGMVEEGETDES